MARTGRPFANLDPPQINTKMCDKRALLSTAQPKGYVTGRRWVRLKGVTVTRSYVNTDEHWQSMSINGNQYQSMEINRDQWQNIVELSNRAVVLPFNTGGAHGGPGSPSATCEFRPPHRAALFALRPPLRSPRSPPMATCLFGDWSPGVATCLFSFILPIIGSLPLLPYCHSVEFELALA
jgi:hypothetical protein